jgi:uncharacterized membrane protein
MRTAVLVVNYIIVGILGISFLGLSSQSQADASTTIAGIVMLTPVVVVNLVYAHSQRNK